MVDDVFLSVTHLRWLCAMRYVLQRLVTARFHKRLHVPGTLWNLPPQLRRHSLLSDGSYNLLFLTHLFLTTDASLQLVFCTVPL